MALWRDIAGYEGLYLISDKGEVLSLPRKGRCKKKLLKPHLRGKKGLWYPAVTLTKDGKSKAFSIHRLVAIAFIPNPQNLPEINHKDENTLNYSIDNLEWCDRQYNIEYSKAKRVSQYKDGVKLAEYKSTVYASEITGIQRRSITNALKGWSKTAGGYEWKYSDD